MIKLLKSFVNVWNSPMGEEKEESEWEIEIDFASKLEHVKGHLNPVKRYSY